MSSWTIPRRKLRPTIASVTPLRAVEGGRITLTGSGFPIDTIPEVTVGGQPALVAFASGTRIAVAIPPDVERYLFEPFFSTRSRGTGLGLYICRELCERYGASIDYRLRTPGDPTRNEFNVTMRRGKLPDMAEPLLT